MSQTYQRILIHPDAATKPAPGAPCNGCGLCCLMEPCPLGILLSRRRRGTCVAVRWDDQLHQYRCGALSEPEGILKSALPFPFRYAARGLSWFLAKVAGRWIAVSQGCDSTLELVELPGQSAAAQDSPTMDNNGSA